MRPQNIRTFGQLGRLVAVLGVASIATGQSLTEQQIGRQIEGRLSEDAFSNVNVSVEASVVSLSGTVPSLWAKEAAIARVLDLADVTSVESDLEIERAESDLAIAEQISKQLRRASIPGPRGPRVGADINEAIYNHASNSFYSIFDYVNGWIDDGVVVLFENFDSHNGPVPSGAPSHAEMIAVTTPLEFRTPAAISFPVIAWTWRGR